MYDLLFAPIKINKLTIKNRLAYPALALAYSDNNKLNDKYYDFYQKRAQGGVGLITVGPIGIGTRGSGRYGLQLVSKEDIPSYSKLTQLISKEGASPWLQLFHAGAYQRPDFLSPGDEALAPSETYSLIAMNRAKGMTLEDIKQVQQAFLNSATLAREANFQGVELIGSAGYLIAEFLSPVRNVREDQYGGSLKNRARFPIEIIKLIKNKLGKDFPLGIRISGNDFVPGANSSKEVQELGRMFQEAGIDIINVTGGWHESKVPQISMELPRGGYAYLASNVKKAVSIPVMASNRISDPKTALRIIKDGQADMLNLGRTLLADPNWPIKAQQGDFENIIPCMACSQGCMDQIVQGKSLYCVTNPQTGYEGIRKIAKTSKPKNIMVIGAGPAGLSAALTASKMGHNVELYEKENEIGGQLIPAGDPPNKGEIWELIRYYQAALKRKEVQIFLNSKISAEQIKSRNPDHFIIACGAKPLVPKIPGIDGQEVFSAFQVLKGAYLPGKRVAVIGGGSVGLETALFLAQKGTITPPMLDFLFKYQAESPERLSELLFNGTHEITVFEALLSFGLDIGPSTRWTTMDNIKRYGIKLKRGTKVYSIKDGLVQFTKGLKGEKKESIQFDNIVLALGSISENQLNNDVKDLQIPYTTIGDALHPAKIDKAIHDGFLAALNLDND